MTLEESDWSLLIWRMGVICGLGMILRYYWGCHLWEVFKGMSMGTICGYHVGTICGSADQMENGLHKLGR